jgi:hypothetical protein
MTLSVNTNNHVDVTRLNAFQMGTGTTGARAINLAKRALEEDEVSSAWERRVLCLSQGWEQGEISTGWWREFRLPMIDVE